MSWAALGALGVGAGYGFVAQRGAFCLNSGFRSVFTTRDLTKVKAFALAVAIQMVALPPLLIAMGRSAPGLPTPPLLGAIIGGLLFGMSMRWAGGCAAGVFYKLGGGDLGALPAAVGLSAGAVLFGDGPLSFVHGALGSLAGTLPRSFGLSPFAPLGLGLLLLAWLSRAAAGTAGAWSWRRTGGWLGVVGLAAWPLSALAARDFGMAVVPGAAALMRTPVASLGGWDTLFVIGLPLGAFLAARRSAGGVERPALPSPRKALQRFAGGVGLGSGASMAAGCTVGHGLTALPLLVPASLLSMLSILAGSGLSVAWQRYVVSARGRR